MFWISILKIVFRKFLISLLPFDELDIARRWMQAEVRREVDAAVILRRGKRKVRVVVSKRT